MPEMNGFEVLDVMRKSSPQLLKRTIVFTAVSDAMLENFNTREIFRLIRKPFDIGDLTTALTECSTRRTSKFEDRNRGALVG
jgi:DNA-binding LytR/AlgR family response regulator